MVFYVLAITVNNLHILLTSSEEWKGLRHQTDSILKSISKSIKRKMARNRNILGVWVGGCERKEKEEES